MAILPFERYIRSGVARKRTPDIVMARSLLESSKERRAFYRKVKGLGQRFAFEIQYDVFRELSEALLALNGYKTWSHEASIAFLGMREFGQHELVKLDQIREARNRSKYYGQKINEMQAIDYVEFLERICKRLEYIVQNGVGNG